MKGRFDPRIARLQKGMTVSGAASRIGIAPQTLRRIEAGEKVWPTSVKKVADFYGVEVLDIADVEQVTA